MVATFSIEERPDSNGSPVYFIMRDGADITSRWTLEDADFVLETLNNQIVAETAIPERFAQGVSVHDRQQRPKQPDRHRVERAAVAAVHQAEDHRTAEFPT